MLCIYVITTVVPLNFFSSIKYYLSSIISQLNLAHPFSLNVAMTRFKQIPRAKLITPLFQHAIDYDFMITALIISSY